MSRNPTTFARVFMSSAIFVLVVTSSVMADIRILRIPLEEGKLCPGNLPAHLMEKMGLPGLEFDSMRINLNGVRGSVLLRAWNAALGDGCRISIEENVLLISVETDKLPHDLDETRGAVRTFTETTAPDATAAQQRIYGILLPHLVDPSRPMIILVHGLDCNRANWFTMSDLLNQHGHQVAYFTYPSDQPLVDSATMLRDQIRLMRTEYPDMPLVLLTHSMGALVAREFVEGPDYAGGVKRLIMIAPPNHGTKWAKYRLALELEEHYYVWRDEPNWSPTWIITDGLGEAARDLSVGSDFLNTLNARERRAEVSYTIIAGNHHPVARFGASAVSATSRLIPTRTRHWWGFRQSYNTLDHVQTRLRHHESSSDGPVSVESAKLEGAPDFILLPGDHTTLYISVDPEIPPPAWEIVKDRLAS